MAGEPRGKQPRRFPSGLYPAFSRSDRDEAAWQVYLWLRFWYGRLLGVLDRWTR